MLNFFKKLFFKPYDVVFFMTYKTGSLAVNQFEGHSTSLRTVNNPDLLITDFADWVKIRLEELSKEFNTPVTVKDMKIIK